MCGIAGIREFRDGIDSASALSDQVVNMTDELSKRGPDKSGSWFDRDAGVALGHRRLSIIDLSSTGNQPMISSDGRWVITFNGEIYNYHELRKQSYFSNHEFRGGSDTEVLLENIAIEGLENTLLKCRGMFALALWDRRSRDLYLARDRFGEKPLYYYYDSGQFLFASELKALHRHTAFKARVDRDALCLFFRHNYIPAPYTIYKKTFQLPPSTWMRVNSDGTTTEPIYYWQFSESVIHGINNPIKSSRIEAVDQLENLLLDVVRDQMISDVPLGALLSGGIDSSCVVAMMKKVHSGPVRTFSVAYDEAVYNEADHAAAVASHLQTDHTELRIRSNDVLDIIPSLPDIYDEPFADASQLPTTLISRLTRQHVTVALSGDAGDEAFGGYNRYFWAARIHKLTGWLPSSARRLLACAIRTPSVACWDSFYDSISPALPGRFRFSLPGDKLYKLASVLNYKNRQDLYRLLVSHWFQPENLVINGQEPTWLQQLEQSMSSLNDYSRWMMSMDTRSYLANDILTKVDRAAMSCSLETRVPFLDHRVVEFAWSLPTEFLINGGQGKQILRDVLYRHVPKSLLDRPKMGFGVPIDDWLRGPLRDWVEHQLDENRIKQAGLIHWEPVRQRWEEHLSGKRNWQYHLWSILMFQAWHEKWA